MMARADWPQLSLQIYKEKMWDIESNIRDIIVSWGIENYVTSGIVLGAIQHIYQNHMPSDSFNGIDLHDTDVSL